MNLPVPDSTLGRLVERCVVVAVIAVIGVVLSDASTVIPGSIAYTVLATVRDLLNSNIDNI